MKKFVSMALVLALMLTMITGCAGGSSSNVAAEKNNTEAAKYDKEVDFLVIGGGGAGLAAAIEASDKGVEDVLVVEKLGQIGGTTFISQGMIAGFDSKVQKAEPSVPTNFDEMYANLMHNASYRRPGKGHRRPQRSDHRLAGRSPGNAFQERRSGWLRPAGNDARCRRRWRRYA